MRPLAAAPETLMESAATCLMPPGTTTPWTARIPALANIQIAMKKAPANIVGRRPQRSIQIRAGTVMMTLIMYWIESASSSALPVYPAMLKMVEM